MFPPPILAFWPWTAATTALLAAAAAPILIHLWTRQQFLRTNWAAMEHLLAALKKNASRMQFEQWLLLAVRVAILMLAGLAVADPSFSCRLSPGIEQAIGVDTPTHTLLILDGSYSMDSRSGDGTRFDRAKQLASKLLDQHSPGDAYTMLLMTEPPRTVIGEPAFNPQDVSDELAALKLPHTGGNLPATLAAAAQIIDRARLRTQPRLDRHRIVVLTDMGKSTWREAESAEVRRIVSELTKSEVPIEVVDVGGDAGDNLALVRLEERNPLVTPGRDTVFEAQIQSFAKRDVERATLQFFVDGRQVHSETLRVPAERLRAARVACIVLDGDMMRTGLNSDLSFSAEDRRENVRRNAEVAKLCNAAGLVVLTQLQPISVMFTLPQQALPRVTSAMQAGNPTVLALSQSPAGQSARILDRGTLTHAAAIPRFAARLGCPEAEIARRLGLHAVAFESAAQCAAELRPWLAAGA